MSEAGFTLYDVLGIAPEATGDEIKTAYRRKQRVTHPDGSGSTETQSLFVLINKAYEVLSDPVRRREYDVSLSTPRSYENTYADTETPPAAAEPEAEWGTEAGWDAYDTYTRVNESILPHKQYAFQDEWFSPLPRSLKKNKLFIAISVVSLLIIAGIFITVGQPEMLLGYAPLALLMLLVAFTRFGRKLLVSVAAIYTVALLGFGLISLGQEMEIQNKLGAAILCLVATAVVVPLTIAVLRYQSHKDVVLERIPRLMSYEEAKYHSWGDPGAGLWDAEEKFGGARVEQGISGERKTATALETLYDIPGVRVFHGMRFPAANTQADVDHFVVCGNKIAIIDSKSWTPARYEWSPYGAILENGGKRERNVDALVHSSEKYKQIFAGCEVRSWVLIHPSDSGRADRLVLDNAYATSIILGSAQSTLTDLSQWFSEGNNGVVDRGLLHAVRAWMK
jgi:DnaJ domain/Nuclease-related domain